MTLLTGWESLRELSAMQDRMNRMNRLFREPYSPEGPAEALTTTALAPPVDIYEDEYNIILKIDVPGIDEKDIDVSIQNNTLAVTAIQAFSARTCLIELSGYGIQSLTRAKRRHRDCSPNPI